jgi:tetratricopeptide (TPR) repeat protein
VGSAGERYREALDMARQLGDQEAEAPALTGLALCSSQEGDLRHALGRYEQVLAITEQTGDDRLTATVCGNVGSIMGELGRASEGLEFLERALALALVIEDHVIEGDCRSQLAAILVDLGDVDAAVEQARRAARIGDQMQNPRLAQDGYGALAAAQLHADALGEARAAIETAVQRGAGSRTRGHDALALLGIIALRQDDEPAARRALSKARGRAENLLRAGERHLPRVLDSKGVVLSGLALCGHEAPADQVDHAVAAFQSARSICSESGMIERVVRLLDALSLGNDRASLITRVRVAARGAEGSVDVPGER